MQKTNLERRIVVFDLDTALLQENFIDVCARNFNFSQALSLLRQIDQDPLNILNRAASFMRGRSMRELFEIIENIPLSYSAIKVVNELKSRSCLVGIISNSYQLIAEKVGEKINADFVIANELKTEGNVITEGFSVSPCFYQSTTSSCRHRTCKTNALRFLCEQFEIPLRNSIVVGDYDLDDCLRMHAGSVVSFDPAEDSLAHDLMAF
jgi:phosphoserine phosphatase